MNSDYSADAATNPDQFTYAVFPHTDDWAVAAGGARQLGGYFEDEARLAQALNQWGALGWSIPNISVSWEKFNSGLGSAEGYRIRNGGAPVVMGAGLSAVVAVRRTSPA